MLAKARGHEVALYEKRKRGGCPNKNSEKPHVCSVMEFTGDRNMELGQTVLMVGGGLVGAEIAYNQAKKGKKAILTTRRTSMFEVANDNSSPIRR